MVRIDGRAEAGARRADEREEPALGDDNAALDALAKAAMGNEPDAMRKFLTAIGPTILRACRGVMGGDHPDLDDVVQNSLFDTMRALPHYRFEGHVAHYATKISIRLAIAARRRGAARSARFAPLVGHESIPAPGDSSGCAGLELEELVRQVVDSLSPVQAETLMLRVLLGFSIEEIAAIAGVPVDTVKTRLRAGKKLLRERLAEAGPLPYTGKR
jgi:RNA polymerase sigma-70 factor (ECF subfamily)